MRKDMVETGKLTVEKAKVFTNIQSAFSNSLKHKSSTSELNNNNTITIYCYYNTFTKRCSFLVFQHVKQETSLFLRSFGRSQDYKDRSRNRLSLIPSNSLSLSRNLLPQSRGSLLEDVFDVWISVATQLHSVIFHWNLSLSDSNMSEIFHFPASPSQSQVTIREIQQDATGAQLGPVEENVGTDDANSPAVFQRTEWGILACSYNSGDRTTMTDFDRGQHVGFIQAHHHVMSQFTPPINQTQIEDPFEGSVHIFQNDLSTRVFPLLDQTWNAFSSLTQTSIQIMSTTLPELTTCKSPTFSKLTEMETRFSILDTNVYPQCSVSFLTPLFVRRRRSRRSLNDSSRSNRTSRSIYWPKYHWSSKKKLNTENCKHFDTVTGSTIPPRIS